MSYFFTVVMVMMVMMVMVVMVMVMQTWCSILSMSIGGWATASRGIGLGRVPVQ